MMSSQEALLPLRLFIKIRTYRIADSRRFLDALGVSTVTFPRPYSFRIRGGVLASLWSSSSCASACHSVDSGSVIEAERFFRS